MAQQIARISIIIPAYNHQEWIVAAVNSVQQQTYSNWELIIIDDASSDDTWRVLQTIQEARMQCVRHEKNLGAQATLNEGMALATGEYLAILNSDDRWHPERLQRLYQAAQSEQADFLATDVRLIDADGQSNIKNERQAQWLAWFEGLKADFAMHQQPLVTLLLGNFLIGTSNFFMKAAVWQSLQGFRDLRYVHDYDFILRALSKGYNLYYLPKVLLDYRQHERNTINESPIRSTGENLQLLYAFIPQLAAQAAIPPRAWQNLHTHLRRLQQYLHGEWCARLHNELTTQAEQWQQWVTDRDVWINERDQLLTQQQQWIADRDVWINERDQLLTQQQQWIADRDVWISERDKVIADLQYQHQQLMKSYAFRLGTYLLKPLKMLRSVLGGKHYA